MGMYKEKSLPIGYKLTKIGVIPTQWAVKSLAECFSISAGRDLIKETFSAKKTIEHCFPIFSNSMENRGLYGYTSNPRYKAGSLTVTGRGTLGVAEFRTESFDAIIRLLVLTPKMELCGKLIAEYINYRKPFFFECTGIPQLTAPQISKILIPIPPIDEQKKIVEVLSEWDKAIELQTKLIGKLELRKRALMQRLLTGRVRLNGFSEKWEKKKLDEIGTVYNGLSGKNKDDFEKGNSHFITYMNIFSNECIKKDMLGKVNIAQKEQQNRVQYGDIFFTVSSETPKEVGMTSVLLQDLADTYLNSFCFGFRPYNFNTLLPHFAMYFFRSSEFRKKMYTIAQGSTRYNIGKSDVLGMNICIPPIAEQHIIAEVLSTADKEIEIAKNKLSSLCHQKRGLMQQLLTGKKRIKL